MVWVFWILVADVRFCTLLYGYGFCVLVQDVRFCTLLYGYGFCVLVQDVRFCMLLYGYWLCVHVRLRQCRGFFRHIVHYVVDQSRMYDLHILCRGGLSGWIIVARLIRLLKLGLFAR